MPIAFGYHRVVMSSKPPGRHRALLLGLIVAPIALLALGLWLEPDPRGYGTHEQLGLMPCFTMSEWGVPCPGCGLTTALSLASHGHPLQAITVNPLGPALLGLAFVAAVWALAAHRRNGDLKLELARLGSSRWGTWIGIAVALTWVLQLARLRG